MGYYTSFEMEINNIDELDNTNSGKIACDFYRIFFRENITDNEILNTTTCKSIEELGAKVFENNGDLLGTFDIDYWMKWYDWDSDMKEFSNLHPNLKITLGGKGEDSEDMWICYFYNYKSQYCPVRIVFDDCELF